MTAAMDQTTTNMTSFAIGRRKNQRMKSLDRKHAIQAMQLLEQHPHFHGRTRLLKIHCHRNRLRLSGILPSYFLKQLAQEAIRTLGHYEIDNRIVVTGMIGEMFCDREQAPGQELGKLAIRRTPK